MTHQSSHRAAGLPGPKTECEALKCNESSSNSQSLERVNAWSDSSGRSVSKVRNGQFWRRVL
eukprot:4819560-Pyramimonas_sp.AAC.1